MSIWTKLTLDVPGDLSDLVSGLLFEAGTSGIEVEDGADRTHVRMSAYFERAERRAAATAALDRLRTELTTVFARSLDLWHDRLQSMSRRRCF